MIDGLEETINALREMGKNIDTKSIKEMLKKEGNKIVSDAKARCISRHVRNAITLINPDNIKYPTTVLVGIDYDKPGIRGQNSSIYFKDKGVKRFIVREDVTLYKLADMIEYGSAPRWTKDGEYRGEFPAKPFMRTSFDMNKSSIEDSIKKNLVDIIEKQAKKNNLK